MANYVKIATIGPSPPQVPSKMKPQEIVDFMLDFWRQKFEQVLTDKPDLIVVPETCDLPAPNGFELQRRQEYYRQRKNQIRDFFAQTAKKNNCYMVYCSVREAEDGVFYNSSAILDRKGKVAGIYNKNYLVPEERTKERTKDGILSGKDAPIIECDFGRVACLVCFDLNYAQLCEKYIREKPDLLIFSSMYHGGDVAQSNWAYSCRSHFVSAVADLPCEIRNPYGAVIASSTNYRDYSVGKVNLDCCMVHYDFNYEKLNALKKKYGNKVNIHDPGYFGSVLVFSETDETTAVDMAREFEIELLDEYLTRGLSLHQKHENIEN